ncbi:sulfatase-like hydrolase/transferase [Adhaeretor mobilis]|uniref:Arylsulfatase n=1 Tax=Adhaeretor mobilis TaxID=1930276 RepID=A0A517N188_9BACT|nr:sulfatase-like hydrolase/transferase [Adhaeretor mobilis]QDT00893.1 Arylsulfatase [Adhaeretor mobilis]
MHLSNKLLCRYFATIMLLMSSMPVGASDKPNIIVIVADDLGYGDVGCFGSTEVETPHIDALAADGVRLTDFHSNGSVCSPTRAALLTGRYQQRTGIVGVVTAKSHRHTGLDLQETTFAEILKTAGYTTALFGKWHVGYQPAYNPIRQGFDEYTGFVAGNVDYHAHLDQTGEEDWWKQDELTPEAGYSTDLITDYGVDFIKRNHDKPFLLYLAHAAPHYPYQGREEPQFYTRGKGKRKNPFRPGVYEEMIEVMDEGVGRIRQALKDASVEDNTLIVFFSDNGPARPGSVGPLRGRKGAIWEGGHRVPAVACWPGQIKAGRVSEETVMGADLLPTMAEMSGASLPEEVTIDGESLLDHLTNASPLAPRPIFWSMGTRLAIRKGAFKLVTTTAFKNPVLYNLETDLGEKHDLAEQHPELVSEFIKLLKDWHKDVTNGVKKRT